MTRKTFTKGDKIKDNYGNVFTVYQQTGNVIEVYEINGTIHATKAHAA